MQLGLEGGAEALGGIGGKGERDIPGGTGQEVSLHSGRLFHYELPHLRHQSGPLHRVSVVNWCWPHGAVVTSIHADSSSSRGPSPVHLV